MARYRVGLETRERILDAVRLRLGRDGLDNLTLKAILDEAGVGSGSFYNLFESKEEAVFEVVRDAITAVDPDPAGTGDEDVRALVAAFVEFIGGQPEVATIYLQLAVAGGLADPRIAARVQRNHRARVQRFHDALRRERPELPGPEAQRRAESLAAALNGCAVTWLLDPSFDLEGHAHGLGALALRP